MFDINITTNVNETNQIMGISPTKIRIWSKSAQSGLLEKKNMVDQEMQLLGSSWCKEWLYLPWLSHVGPKRLGKPWNIPSHLVAYGGNRQFYMGQTRCPKQLLEVFLESDSILGAEVHQRKDRVSERSGGEACSGAADLLRRRRLLFWTLPIDEEVNKSARVLWGVFFSTCAPARRSLNSLQKLTPS